MGRDQGGERTIRLRPKTVDRILTLRLGQGHDLGGGGVEQRAPPFGGAMQEALRDLQDHMRGFDEPHQNRVEPCGPVGIGDLRENAGQALREIGVP